MKIVIDIDNDYFEIIKYRVEHGDDYKPYTLIANGTPYDGRQHGEWLFHRCSLCGRYDARDNENFCSNCGADMRKGGAEE